MFDICHYHVLPLLVSALLEQMTKEVPGIRPAVISPEAGKRLDEHRRFRHVVRNVYTHSFDPTKPGKLVNSAPELFARTKAELLALTAKLSIGMRSGSSVNFEDGQSLMRAAMT
jgi:hypothetical protein